MTIYNYEAYMVLQIFGLSLLAIAIAMPIYNHVRSTSPELGWNYHGNVPTSQFNPLDILGVIVATIVFVSNILLLPFLDPSMLEDTSKMSGAFIVIAGIITQMIPAGIAVLFLVFRFNILEIFGIKRPDWKRIAVTVILGMVAIIVLANLAGLLAEPLLKQAFGEKNPQQAVQMMMDAKANNPKLLIGLGFLACIVAPICEEIVFRGYFYAVMKRYSCRYFSAVITGLIFGLVHGSMWSLAPLVVIGIILAVVYELSGSLWAPIICHCLFNSMTTIYMIFFYDVNSLPY